MQISRIIESVLDPKQPTLSKHVFQDGKLLLPVRFKILRGWARINDIGPATKLLIVGSIGTYNYSDESDVDITIRWAGTTEGLEEARKIAISLNGKDFAGPHEINYFVRKDVPTDYFDAIYDVFTDRWLKGPAEIGVNVDKYMARFEEVASTISTDKAELLSDLADYRAIKNSSDSDRAKAQKIAKHKLAEIEKDVQSLGDQFLEVKSARSRAFDNADLEYIKQYSSRNAVPENVIYLLLRRYCYLHFLHTIYEISKDGVQKSELGDVQDAYGDFGSCKVARGFDEKLSESLCSINEPSDILI